MWNALAAMLRLSEQFYHCHCETLHSLTVAQFDPAPQAGNFNLIFRHKPLSTLRHAQRQLKEGESAVFAVCGIHKAKPAYTWLALSASWFKSVQSISTPNHYFGDIRPSC